jgi:hypothetical protein
MPSLEDELRKNDASSDEVSAKLGNAGFYFIYLFFFFLFILFFFFLLFIYLFLYLFIFLFLNLYAFICFLDYCFWPFSIVDTKASSSESVRDSDSEENHSRSSSQEVIVF